MLMYRLLNSNGKTLIESAQCGMSESSASLSPYRFPARCFNSLMPDSGVDRWWSNRSTSLSIQMRNLVILWHTQRGNVVLLNFKLFPRPSLKSLQVLKATTKTIDYQIERIVSSAWSATNAWINRHYCEDLKGVQRARHKARFPSAERKAWRSTQRRKDCANLRINEITHDAGVDQNAFPQSWTTYPQLAGLQPILKNMSGRQSMDKSVS